MSNLEFSIYEEACPNIHAQGHNKWSKVKHTKGAKDAKRGKLFSKISLEIVSSIKAGGADASVNGRLAAALSKAKHAMMPKDSVDVAIKKVMLMIYIYLCMRMSHKSICRQLQNLQAMLLRMLFTKATALEA